MRHVITAIKSGNTYVAEDLPDEVVSVFCKEDSGFLVREHKEDVTGKEIWRLYVEHVNPDASNIS
jgi:hypothetical protein